MVIKTKCYFSILSFKTWDIFKFRTFIIFKSCSCGKKLSMPITNNVTFTEEKVYEVFIIKRANEAWIIEICGVKLRCSQRISIDDWIHALDKTNTIIITNIPTEMQTLIIFYYKYLSSIYFFLLK